MMGVQCGSAGPWIKHTTYLEVIGNFEERRVRDSGDLDDLVEREIKDVTS